ncbi:SLBB domain-containing protein [candidate division WOR-3 bacterium]|nr:SLBB domain-containing protein [candidate division WOR-3 bacterium]
MKDKVIALIFFLLQVQDIQSPGAKYYVYLGGVGELQIKVSIWGEIVSPGLYSIPDGTDLVTLLSLAGGPMKGANLSRVKVIHSFPTPSVVTVNLSDFFKTGNRENIPIMKPGDMVRINQTFFSRVKGFTHNITETTLVVLVYLQLYNMLKK